MSDLRNFKQIADVQGGVLDARPLPNVRTDSKLGRRLQRFKLEEISFTLITSGAVSGQFLIYDGANFRPSFTSVGRLGLGEASTRRFHALDSPVNTTFTGSATVGSVGWIIDKTAAGTGRHGVLWEVGGNPRWEICMEADTTPSQTSFLFRDANSAVTRLSISPTGRVSIPLELFTGVVAAGVTNRTTNYTLTTTERFAFVDASTGSVTVTLPLAATCPGRAYDVKKTDSSVNTVTIAAAGAETIDGGTTAVITVQYESVTVVSDGVRWHIV